MIRVGAALLFLCALFSVAACDRPAAETATARAGNGAGDRGSGAVRQAPAIECPDSDTRPTLFLGDCDTGVANRAIGDCTLADHLGACAAGPAEALPSCIAKTTESWIAEGVLVGGEKGLIQLCATPSGERDPFLD